MAQSHPIEVTPIKFCKTSNPLYFGSNFSVMLFQPNQLYHLYNRSNNKELLFYNRDNYLYFLRKIRNHFVDFCDCLAYCLMPTHFHFLLYSKDSIEGKAFNKAIGVILRSYTQAINKQNDRHGSLFQAHTKAKPLGDDLSLSIEYATICFHYIHQNPLASSLVNKMEDWEFSSFRDYIGIRNGNFCNKYLARELIGIESDPKRFTLMLMP